MKSQCANKKDLFLGILLFSGLLLIGFSAWFFAGKTNIQYQNTSVESTDLNVSNITIKKYNTKGELVQWIESPLISHFIQNNSHLIQSPHMVVKDTDKPSLDIRSLYAISLLGGAHITFLHNVNIHQDASNTATASHLQTEELIYLPKEKKALTDKKIRFEQAGTVIYSQGFRANLGDQQIVHLSKAKAIQKPAQS